MDGDCGLDVMCLMLAWKRSRENRCLLRKELGVYALKHVGNRAFVAMLHEVGELKTHLGFYELESAGALLIESHHGDGAVLESHHGDGVQLAVLPPGPDANGRHFSGEEIRAMAWKCRLQKASREFIVDMLERLPQECVNATTTSFRNYQVEKATEGKAMVMARPTFLVSRDANLNKKRMAT